MSTAPTTPAPDSAAPALGTLQVLTDPAPLVVCVFDHQMRCVATGISPMRFSLPQGVYLVVASRPGVEDLRSLTWVAAGAAKSIRLSASDPGLVQRLLTVSSRSWDSFLRRAAVPELLVARPVAEAPAAIQPFSIRFARLYDWKHAQITPPLKYSTTITGTRAVLDVTNPETSVIFAQLAGAGLVRNVALPPGAPGQPSRFQLLIDSAAGDLKVRVQLSTDWAQSALKYMMQGYAEQARLVVAPPARSAEAGAAAAPARRFDDAAAALVPRYLGLRLDDAAIFNSSPAAFVDVLDRLSDGLILTAELAVRQGQYRQAAASLLKIAPGALPLFTEGYSLLVQRLRELPDLDADDIPAGQVLSDETRKQLRDLRRAVGRWSAYIDLDSPTLVFPGEDPARPTRAGATPAETGDTPAAGPGENLNLQAPGGGASPSQPNLPAVPPRRDSNEGWTAIDNSIVTSIKGALTMSASSATGPISGTGPSWPVLGPSSTGTGSGFPVGLIQEIDDFVGMCEHNYRFNSLADTWVNLAGIILSVGIVVAGVYKRADFATILGAIMTAMVTAQRAFPFNQRWQFYRTLLSQALNLATKAKNGSVTPDQAVAMLGSLRLDFAQQIPRGSTNTAEPQTEDHPQGGPAAHAAS